MSHALVTIIAPLALDRLDTALERIEAIGNPAHPAVSEALQMLDGDDGIHFASVHALKSGDGASAYIVLEFSADGTEDSALERLAAAVGNDLATVFSLASDWRNGENVLTYLRHHRASIGHGWFDSPGITFVGTPGMSVGRIHKEKALAARIVELLGNQPGGMSALERLQDVRKILKADPVFAPALEPALPAPPFAQQPLPALIAGMTVSFIATYLWPIVILLAGWAIYRGIARADQSGGFLSWIGGFALGAVPALVMGSLVALFLVLILAAGVYLRLRGQEATDSVDERTLDAATLAAIYERENRAAQNHMISVTRRKPGIVRWFTSRLVFWAIAELATRLYPPGFLSDIGTIHFARWVTVPGKSRDFLFFSNYGGSWESYLEDFITKAHAGLTGVWSNAIGFPRAENLIEKGATDGERFKRYARHSMLPTRFWYTAYPDLTTANIRTNAGIRRGLSGAMTEDEACAWLALFGSTGRPESTLVTTEIQSLIFGGLNFLPFGSCLLYRLPDDVGKARRWLAAIKPHIAFNDGRRLVASKEGEDPAVVTLGVAADGLSKLGLPAEGLQTFPPAFLDGITSRARILGDVNENDPEKWLWGRQASDVALLVYGATAPAVANLEARLDAAATTYDVKRDRRVPLKQVTQNKTEPFGFVDGISQPVIRGTYKGRRNADPIHLVEPGEFILGYPDDRGNRPPGPTLPALADPENLLPLVDSDPGFSTTVVDSPRDLGANGSFLVIRELEQDVEGFHDYCDAEAKRLEQRLAPPYEITRDFIAAKLIGRWPDGSSLVRNPYIPRTEEKTRHPYASAHGTAHVSHGHDRDNDFLFGAEDPEALRCPFGAHIRRANPRDSLDPGFAEQISITNRHRIIRVGRHYEPMEGQNPGLLFMCLNGDLERQFEFVQQTWLGSPSFHGLACERDALVGDGVGANCSFTIPSRDGPVRLRPLPRFVTTRGGGYFFLPGKRLIDYLS